MFGKKKESVDQRIYVSNTQAWKVKVKNDWNHENCYHKKEGEDFFHGFVKGEIYFDSGSEKLCMNCAIKHNILTENRHHWQKESGDFVEEIIHDDADSFGMHQEE